MSRLTSVHTSGLCAESIGGTLARALADYRLGPTEQAEIGSAALRASLDVDFDSNIICIDLDHHVLAQEARRLASGN